MAQFAQIMSLDLLFQILVERRLKIMNVEVSHCNL